MKITPRIKSKKEKKNGIPLVNLCPNCGGVLYYRFAASDGEYGCPFRPCPGCGIEYFDPRWKEPALEKEPKLPELPRTVWGYVGLGLAFLLGAVFMAGYRLELVLLGALMLALSVWSGLEWRRELPERRAKLEEELKASAARVAKASYLERLMQNGVKVPKKIHHQPK